MNSSGVVPRLRWLFVIPRDDGKLLFNEHSPFGMHTVVPFRCDAPGFVHVEAAELINVLTLFPQFLLLTSRDIQSPARRPGIRTGSFVASSSAVPRCFTFSNSCSSVNGAATEQAAVRARKVVIGSAWRCLHHAPHSVRKAKVKPRSRPAYSKCMMPTSRRRC